MCIPLIMDYQWDKNKAKSNLKKHGIAFADSVGVFEDDWALTLEEQIIDGEQRFITMGMYFLGRIIVVIYTSRVHTIRIISAE